MKKCIRCGRPKDRSQFYAHPKMADGTQNKCKACCIAAERLRRLDPVTGPAIRAYDCARFQRPERKAMALAYQRKMRARYPGKYRARMAVQNAIRSGTLVKKPCEVCGTTQQVHAHHDDYRKPLEVRWFCRPHHWDHHRTK